MCVNALGSQTPSISAIHCLKIVYWAFHLSMATVIALALTWCNPSCNSPIRVLIMSKYSMGYSLYES